MPNLGDGPFEEPFPADATTTHAIDTGETSGTVIGRYQLLQKIGEGGMGEVWLAEQKEPVRRRVALKLVKAGMNTREVIARFESERQALALMDHPAIAKVFDAGSTPQGAPYFVMEYVAGVPITTYCDSHSMTTRERLELFRHVCEGVQHAHQKAIIHRDLKPSNILVTEVDGTPAPKIIDFGVAKALTQRLTADTLFTRVGALVGTPEYMSPEQASSSGEDIDTRSDVYSLGIVFYELMAGAPPLDLRKIPFDEFLRRLREDDPPKLSTKLRAQDPATLLSVAQKRRTDPASLTRLMRGDLDSIALKAVEKDRSRRYGSPSDFAVDIGRYLKNEAVNAVPPSAGYRARKFARRYRVALATVSAFILVLIVAAGVSIRQSLRADREAAVAQGVNDFLQNDVLAQASTNRQAGQSAKADPNLKVRTALDRAAVRIAGKFDKQPDVEAAIRYTMGRTYIDLGVFPEARKQLERALEIQKKTLGADNQKTIETLQTLGEAVRHEGNYSEAETLFKQAYQTSLRVMGAENRETLSAMYSLAVVYYFEREYAKAEALQGKILEIARRTLGPQDPMTLKSITNLANIYSAQNKYAEAEALDSQTLDIQRRVLGPEHPDTLQSMNNLASDYSPQGKFAEAEALFRQTMEIQSRVLGPDHPDTLRSKSNIARAYYDQGKYAEADALFRETLETENRLLGPKNPDTVRAMGNLALAYTAEGKFAQAEALHRQRLATNPESPVFLNELAWYLLSTPDPRERRPQEALQLSRRALKAAPDAPWCYNTLGVAEYENSLWDDSIAHLNKASVMDHQNDPLDFFFLAMAHWKQGDKPEAEQLFQRGAELAAKSGPNGPERRMFWREAAALLGKPGPGR